MPTTPTTALSEASLAAAWAPTSGLAASSSAASSMRQPGTLFFSLACRMASSTEFLMPLPVAVRSPESGTITPILTTLVRLRRSAAGFLLVPPPHAVASKSGKATMADHRQRRFADTGMPNLLKQVP